jgi:hypothetical protein
MLYFIKELLTSILVNFEKSSISGSPLTKVMARESSFFGGQTSSSSEKSSSLSGCSKIEI